MAAEPRLTPAPAPVIQARGALFFVLPGFSRQFTARREADFKSLERAFEGDGLVLMATARREGGKIEYPTVGCVAKVQQLRRFDRRNWKVMLKGVARCRIEKSLGDGTAAWAEIEPERVEPRRAQAIMRSIIQAAGGRDDRHAALARLPKEVYRDIFNEDRPEDCVDFLALALLENARSGFGYELLNSDVLEDRAVVLIQHLSQHHEEMIVDRRIRRRMKKQMERSHKEYHMAEEVKAIQEELQGTGSSHFEKLRRQVEEAGMPDAARGKCEDELRRLRAVTTASPEHAVITEYLKRMLELPWSKLSRTSADLRKAQRVLNEDHYGLEDVKERILEHLAVQRRRGGKARGTILCFVGPPGVGKTSLGRSIARATRREFARISLGGIHEEAAIRGHRRTYVASMPGRVINALAKAKVRNPVLMLDELDKMSAHIGLHGSPFAAMLEVLDPEQNRSFVDQYIDTEFDLSEILFIATANHSDLLPEPLQDRLEMVRLEGYTDREKLAIAQRHIVPRQLELHGLAADGVKLAAPLLKDIIKDYSWESGVRGLERSVAKICRKLTAEKTEAGGQLAPGRRAPGRQRLPELLDAPEHYPHFSLPARSRIGSACGVAPLDGVVPMEALHHPHDEDRIEVMGLTRHGEDQVKALAAVAQTLLRAHAGELGLEPGFHRKKKLCVNLQHGVEGPCGHLGGALFALLYSAYARAPLRPGVAVAGEINLRGDLMGVEMRRGYKSMALDARRHRIRTIVMPRSDEHLLRDVPAELRRQIGFVLAADVIEMLGHVAARPPAPASLPPPARPARPAQGPAN